MKIKLKEPYTAFSNAFIKIKQGEIKEVDARAVWVQILLKNNILEEVQEKKEKKGVKKKKGK